jgi:preprotein translocase subunit SecD
MQLHAIYTDRRVLLLAVVTILALALSVTQGIKFGIDFSGGVRIPVILDRPADVLTMDQMVQTIKTRSATFGLTEVKVRPVGDSEIYVEVPQGNPQLVNDIERLLSKQGVYQGIVDGKVAVSGDEIYSGTIAPVPTQYLQGADWGVSFSITSAGNLHFAEVVQGKANYPLYMFLDRPTDSIVIITRSDLLANTSKAQPISEEVAVGLAKKALLLEGDEIGVYLEETVNASELQNKTNKTKAIISSAASAELKNSLKDRFIIVEKPPEEMRPLFSISAGGAGASDSVNEWKAVGLLSAPRLAPSVTTGVNSGGYTITGPAQGFTAQERALSAEKNKREVESILKGGSLPIPISLGSATSIPAPMGQEFLRLSTIGAALVLIVVSLIVGIRYRSPKFIIPVIFISLSEMIILVSIIGYFTIDLAAMAGIFAAIGVSVDSQIVITDELLKKTGESLDKKLEKAFSIITTNVVVAVVTMLPLLLFSGLVEIIGFATATVLGYVLGILISRPAYGAIAEHLLEG